MLTVLLQLTPAIIAASVAVVVSVLTPSVTSLRARRQAINERFDAGLAALLLVQAARWSPTSMSERPTDATDAEYRAFNVRVREKGIEHYIEKTADAKAALAALAQYVPEVRDQITREWELREADEPELRAAVERRRVETLQSERLFRQRRTVD